MAANRALMDQHPKEAIHHVQMAYTLLAAGVGDQARAEALKATELEPKSAIAFSALGWMLQFNSISVHFGSGFDLQGAKDAYNKAQQLDPSNTDHRANLAILNEYDEQGIRYSPCADLNGAVAEYRQLKLQDAAVANRYEDNLLYALLYARRFDDLLSEAAPLQGSAEHFALIVAATTAQHGAPAGLQRADQLTSNTEVRNTVLRTSGVELLRLGFYSQAADILSEGLQGDQASARAKASSQQLLQTYPDSIVAMRLVGHVDRLNGDFAAWKEMLASRHRKHPNSRELLLLEGDEAESEGDFLTASKDLHAVIDGGEAVTNDYNLYAWLALFTSKVSNDAIEASHQANELTKNASFNELHTLASLYAAQGKTAEARQVILQGMTTANMAVPNSAAWYVFGSIYEHYGIRDAAIAAYRKVEKPEGIVNPVDTWILAQQRLEALHAK